MALLRQEADDVGGSAFGRDAVTSFDDFDQRRHQGVDVGSVDVLDALQGHRPSAKSNRVNYFGLFISKLILKDF